MLARQRIERHADLWADRAQPRAALAWLRRGVFSLAGPLRRWPSAREWVLFPYYHWVLDDERERFAAQIRYLRRHGDVLCLDEALAALRQPEGVGGRYFCLTFDDGFKNWHTNALPVLVELDCPAAFFIPTRYIGLDLDRDWETLAPFYERSWGKYRRYFEFLTWDECRWLKASGFTVGSHTHTHRRLTAVSATEAEAELRTSKALIEAELGGECRHFSCPWGVPGIDFDPDMHPGLARKLGYASFLTAARGPNTAGTSPFQVKRNDVDPYAAIPLFRCLLLRCGNKDEMT